MKSLPPNEPSVDFVPVLHARLAEFPAVEDIAPIDLPAEIDQSGVHPFADDTEVAQLGDVAFDIARQSLRFDLKKISDHVGVLGTRDRKSTRLNSSHRCISYAVFCLKKKK